MHEGDPVSGRLRRKVASATLASLSGASPGALARTPKPSSDGLPVSGSCAPTPRTRIRCTARRRWQGGGVSEAATSSNHARLRIGHGGRAAPGESPPSACSGAAIGRGLSPGRLSSSPGARRRRSVDVLPPSRLPSTRRPKASERRVRCPTIASNGYRRSHTFSSSRGEDPLRGRSRRSLGEPSPPWEVSSLGPPVLRCLTSHVVPEAFGGVRRSRSATLSGPAPPLARRGSMRVRPRSRSSAPSKRTRGTPRLAPPGAPRSPCLPLPLRQAPTEVSSRESRVERRHLTLPSRAARAPPVRAPPEGAARPRKAPKGRETTDDEAGLAPGLDGRDVSRRLLLPEPGPPPSPLLAEREGPVSRREVSLARRSLRERRHAVFLQRPATPAPHGTLAPARSARRWSEAMAHRTGAGLAVDMLFDALSRFEGGARAGVR